MQSKYDHDTSTVQFKIEEMNQIKEDIKESNEFKSNLSFTENMFGSLYLKEFSGFDPFKSQILTGKQPLELIKLCEFKPKDKFKFLYRASRDGFGTNDFHLKCDGKANTLTIFKASESSFIFGGFTTASWDSSSGSKTDPNAFLFSLTNKENQPCKMKIDKNRQQYAIDCRSSCFPSFGYYNHPSHGHDLWIVSNIYKEAPSGSHIGNVYKHPKYNAGTNEANTFLAGSHEFQLSEIEVYQKV